MKDRTVALFCSTPITKSWLDTVVSELKIHSNTELSSALDRAQNALFDGQHQSVIKKHLDTAFIAWIKSIETTDRDFAIKQYQQGIRIGISDCFLHLARLLLAEPGQEKQGLTYLSEHTALCTAPEDKKNYMDALTQLTLHTNLYVQQKAKLALYQAYVGPIDAKDSPEVQNGFDYVCDVFFTIPHMESLEQKKEIIDALAINHPNIAETLRILFLNENSSELLLHRGIAHLKEAIQYAFQENSKTKKYVAFSYLIKSYCYVAIHTKSVNPRDKVIYLTHAIQAIKIASEQLSSPANKALNELYPIVVSLSDPALSVIFWKNKFEMTRSLDDAEKLYQHLLLPDASVESKEIKSETLVKHYPTEKEFLITKLQEIALDIKSSQENKIKCLNMLKKLGDLNAIYQLEREEFLKSGDLNGQLALLENAFSSVPLAIQILTNVIDVWRNLPEGVSLRESILDKIVSAITSTQDKFTKEIKWEDDIRGPYTLDKNIETIYVGLHRNEISRAFFTATLKKLPADMQEHIQFLIDFSPVNLPKRVEEDLSELTAKGLKEERINKITEAKSKNNHVEFSYLMSLACYEKNLFHKRYLWLLVYNKLNYSGASTFNLGVYHLRYSKQYRLALYYLNKSYQEYSSRSKVDDCFDVIMRVFDLATHIRISNNKLALKYAEYSLIQYALLDDDTKKNKLLIGMLTFLSSLSSVNMYEIPEELKPSFVNLIDKIIKLPPDILKQANTPFFIDLCRFLGCSDKAAFFLELTSIEALKKIVEPTEGKSEEKTSDERICNTVFALLEKQALKDQKHTAGSFYYLRERLKIANESELKKIESELKERHSGTFNLSVYNYHLKKCTTTEEKQTLITLIQTEAEKYKQKHPARHEHLLFLAVDICFDLSTQPHLSEYVEKGVNYLNQLDLFKLPTEKFKNIFSRYKNILENTHQFAPLYFLAQAYHKIGDISTAIIACGKIVKLSHEMTENKSTNQSNVLKAVDILKKIGVDTPSNKDKIEPILVDYYRNVFSSEEKEENIHLKTEVIRSIGGYKGLLNLKMHFPNAVAMLPTDFTRACEGREKVYKNVPSTAVDENDYFLSLDLYKQGLETAVSQYNAFWDVHFYTVNFFLSQKDKKSYKLIEEPIDLLIRLGLKRVHANDKTESVTGAKQLLEIACQCIHIGEIASQQQTFLIKAIRCLIELKSSVLLTEPSDLEKLDTLLSKIMSSCSGVILPPESILALANINAARKIMVSAISLYRCLLGTNEYSAALAALKKIANEEKEEKIQKMSQEAVIAYYSRPNALPTEYPLLKLWQRKNSLCEKEYNEKAVEDVISEYKSSTVKPSAALSKEQCNYADALIKRAYHRIQMGSIYHGLWDYQQAHQLLNKVNAIEPVLELFPTLYEKILTSTDTPENTCKALWFIINLCPHSVEMVERCRAKLLELNDYPAQIDQIKKIPLDDSDKIIQLSHAAIKCANEKKFISEDEQVKLAITLLDTLLKSAATLPLEEKIPSSDIAIKRERFYSLASAFIDSKSGRMLSGMDWGKTLAPYYKKNALANFIVEKLMTLIEKTQVYIEDNYYNRFYHFVNHLLDRVENKETNAMMQKATKQNTLYGILFGVLDPSGHGVNEKIVEKPISLEQKKFLRENKELPHAILLDKYRDANLSSFRKVKRSIIAIQALEKEADRGNALAALLLVKIYIKMFKANNRIFDNYENQMSKYVLYLEKISTYSALFLRLSDNPVKLATEINIYLRFIEKNRDSVLSWQTEYRTHTEEILNSLHNKNKISAETEQKFRSRIHTCSGLSSTMKTSSRPPSVAPHPTEVKSTPPIAVATPLTIPVAIAMPITTVTAEPSRMYPDLQAPSVPLGSTSSTLRSLSQALPTPAYSVPVLTTPASVSQQPSAPSPQHNEEEWIDEIQQLPVVTATDARSERKLAMA